jgi:hypothetical protein
MTKTQSAMFAFYISQTPGDGRQPIALPGGGTAYVRVEKASTSDVALPQRGESLMNTLELDV